jgi:hypothetical protein
MQERGGQYEQGNKVEDVDGRRCAGVFGKTQARDVRAREGVIITKRFPLRNLYASNI